jgi:hypothetical protein
MYRQMSNAPRQDESLNIQALYDMYRCPGEFLNFRLGEGMSSHSGYFEFGSGNTCYGRSLSDSNQTTFRAPYWDALPRVSSDGTQVVLPFDPNEVIENLRFERYPTSQWANYEPFLRRLYYRLRPFTRPRLRAYLQRFRAANWESKTFPHWPVDTTVENICEKLLLLSFKASAGKAIPFIWFWPNGARGCVSMTHDVETATGRDFCAQLMDMDDAHGIKASFQIVPESRYEVTPEFLSQIRTLGFEVCVQDLNHDGRLFDDREEFLRRIALINSYGRKFEAKGYRSAVLYRKTDWYKDIDFSYDMSIPNVAHLDPQRGGCCTVRPYFIGDILELPVTTIQDYTLFNVLGEQSVDLWKKQLAMILAKNGLASFIVHPDYITEPETQAVYKALLGMLTELRNTGSVWFALPGEIDSWWRARSQMSLVKQGESWRIVGEGAERATLAFAREVDGQLVYELDGAPKGKLPSPNLLSRKNSALLVDEL